MVGDAPGMRRGVAVSSVAGLPHRAGARVPEGAGLATDPRRGARLPAGHVSCVDVAPADEAELAAMGHGRLLLVDYLLAPRLAPFPVDVQLRWVAGPAALPDDAVCVDDLRLVRAFVQAPLGPILARVRARIMMVGPRRIGFLRHAVVTLPNRAAWTELFDALHDIDPFG